MIKLSNSDRSSRVSFFNIAHKLPKLRSTLSYTSATNICLKTQKHQNTFSYTSATKILICLKTPKDIFLYLCKKYFRSSFSKHKNFSKQMQISPGKVLGYINTAPLQHCGFSQNLFCKFLYLTKEEEEKNKQWEIFFISFLFFSKPDKWFSI